MNHITGIGESMSDPVYEKDGKWYFYDETWRPCGGPYDTEEEARSELSRYIETQLGP